MRLNKFISESGICSRREADAFIERGLVTINKRKAGIGDQVQVGDRVVVNGMALEPRKGEDIIFIALNKPVGIVSTTEDVKDNIVRFVNHSARIFPIGRLDKDSQGLIFLTNNGDLVNKILRAGNNHEKEYVVTVNKPLTQSIITSMSNGVPMLGVMTKKCKIEGLNRQIRRMCEHFGYEVTKLERVRIMNISLKGLPVGDWRDLTESEMKTIYAMIAMSSGEDKKKQNNTSQKKHNQVRKSSSPSSTKKTTGKERGKTFGKKTVRRGR
jgi:23S rRNA pseudouridine2604 synthase